MLVAELAAVAMVGIIVTVGRFGIERFAVPNGFARYLGAVAEAEIAGHVQATPVTVITIAIAVVVAIIVAVIIAVVVAIVVAAILGGRQTGGAGDHCKSKCCPCQLVFHTSSCGAWFGLRLSSEISNPNSGRKLRRPGGQRC